LIALSAETLREITPGHILNEIESSWGKVGNKTKPINRKYLIWRGFSGTGDTSSSSGYGE